MSMSKSKSLAIKSKKKKKKMIKKKKKQKTKMSCLDCLMALRLSPVYLHTLKWHWHWKCLCHRQSHAPLPPASHCILYCIVFCFVELCRSTVVPYGPRQIERSPNAAAVSVSASHYRRMASLPLLRLLSPSVSLYRPMFFSRIALLTVVVNGITIFSSGFVLRQFMSDCID